MNWGLGEGTRMITGVSMCRHASMQDAANVRDWGEHRAEALHQTAASPHPQPASQPASPDFKWLFLMKNGSVKDQKCFSVMHAHMDGRRQGWWLKAWMMGRGEGGWLTLSCSHDRWMHWGTQAQVSTPFSKEGTPSYSILGFVRGFLSFFLDHFTSPNDKKHSIEWEKFQFWKTLPVSRIHPPRHPCQWWMFCKLHLLVKLQLKGSTSLTAENKPCTKHQIQNHLHWLVLVSCEHSQSADFLSFKMHAC